MADVDVVRVVYSGGDSVGFAELQTGETLAVAHGGTGATTLAEAGILTNTGSQTINGDLGIGGAPLLNVLISGIGDSAVSASRSANINLFTYSSTLPNLASNLAGVRFRGSAAAPSAVLSGDRLFGVVAGGGYDSSSFSNSAAIDLCAAENYSAGSTGSYVAFLTTLAGSTGRAERLRIDGAGNVLVTNTGGLGYGTGAGGTADQPTQNAGSQVKGNNITLNKPSGQVTMGNAAIAAGDTVFFTLSNSLITINDTLLVNLGGAVGDYSRYEIKCCGCGAGVAVLSVKNIHTASLSDAIKINFAVIRGAIA